MASQWRHVLDTECEDTGGVMQLENFPEFDHGTTATFLKFRLESGWDDYSTVHKVSVEGTQR